MRKIPSLEEHFEKSVGHTSFELKDIKYFTKNRDSYISMFNHQGNDFWVRYVIKLREAILEHYDDCLSIDEFDYLFIDLLKKLTTKNKQSAVQYLYDVCLLYGSDEYLPDYEAFVKTKNPKDHETVSQVAKSFYSTTLEPVRKEHYMYIYIVVINCACALIRLLRLWLECDEGEDGKWIPPTQWRASSYASASPFDTFLRSRWGGDLTKVLKIKKEYIGWWRAPPRVPATECWCSPLSCGNSDEDSNLDAWLPKPEPRPKPTDKNQLKFDFYAKLEANGTDIHKWDVFDVSMGPILNPTYHHIDIENLLAEVDDKHHMGVGPWYIAWNIAFGYQMYLNHLQTHHELMSITEKNDEEKKQQWIDEMSQSYNTLVAATQMNYAPRAFYDTAFIVEEFLLEPCILIKLAWQPVLLQQWLSVALHEIMKFEMDSLELRHWPIPIEIERCVCELLSFIADAKQRILLGLCFHVQQCVAFPKLSDNFPQMLMETSIQLSLPALKFLTEGEGEEVLKNLKNIAFSKERGDNARSFEKSVYIPDTAYKVDVDMSRFYTRHYWHIHNWLGKNLDEPLPYHYSLDNFDMAKYVRINPLIAHGIPVPLPRNTGELHSQGYSQEEEKLRVYFAKFDFKVQPKDRIMKTLDVVKEYVFKPQIFPAADWDRFLKIALVKGAQITNLYSENQNMSLISQLVLYSMLHDNISGILNGIDAKHSTLVSLVRMSGEILEKEQRVRVGNICAQMLKKCPVLNHESENTSTIAEISNTITLAGKEKSKFTLPVRSLRWLKFNADWREEIDMNDTAPKFSEGVNEWLRKFEIRLGRMLLKEHKESYAVWEREGDVFPHSYETQYLVPEYVSALVSLQYEPKGKRSEKKIQRYLNFLHRVIRYYEESLIAWINDKDSKRNSSLPIYVFDSVKRACNFMLQKMYIIPTIRQMLHAFVGLGIGFEGAPGFQEVFDSMKEWPVKTQNDVHNVQVESMTVMAWEFMSFNHTLLLYKLCHQIWQLPQPKSDFGDSLLEKVYFVSTVIHKINIIITVQATHFPLIVFMDEFQKFVSDDIDEDIENIKRDVICRIAQFAGLVEKDKSLTEEMLNQQMEEHISVLTVMFQSMCAIRERLSDTKLFCPEFPPNDPLCVKNAVALFMANKISLLSRILDLLSEKAPVLKAPKKSKKKPVSNDDSHNHQNRPLHKCRKCSKISGKKSSFIVCDSCIANNYPDVNYYCSQKCKDEWWSQEHMAEHLEFDLGLSDLCQSQQPIA